MEKTLNIATVETKEKLTKVINESGLPLIILDYLIKDLSTFLSNSLAAETSRDIDLYKQHKEKQDKENANIAQKIKEGK